MPDQSGWRDNGVDKAVVAALKRTRPRRRMTRAEDIDPQLSAWLTGLKPDVDDIRPSAATGRRRENVDVVDLLVVGDRDVEPVDQPSTAWIISARELASTSPMRDACHSSPSAM